MNKEDFLFSKRVTTSRQLKTISYDEVEDFEHGKPDLRLTLTRKQLEALSKGKVLAYEDQYDCILIALYDTKDYDVWKNVIAKIATLNILSDHGEEYNQALTDVNKIISESITEIKEKVNLYEGDTE